MLNITEIKRHNNGWQYLISGKGKSNIVKQVQNIQRKQLVLQHFLNNIKVKLFLANFS